MRLLPAPPTAPLLRDWEWQAEAACRGMDSAAFFPPTGERGGARRRREEAARAVCLDCPVSGPCDSFALRSRQPYGVWGGRTETERRSAVPAVPGRARRAAEEADVSVNGPRQPRRGGGQAR
ncbi:WhiB family transcriptional regulator [Streptomyces sp. NPDC005576]|uniref:WhiB family transcriptional regulator n=1 Tax=unclassified Streptomyces TaxID=2593676 RepID=UPI0033F1D5D8